MWASQSSKAWRHDWRDLVVNLWSLFCRLIMAFVPLGPGWKPQNECQQDFNLPFSVCDAWVWMKSSRFNLLPWNYHPRPLDTFNSQGKKIWTNLASVWLEKRWSFNVWNAVLCPRALGLSWVDCGMKNFYSRRRESTSLHFTVVKEQGLREGSVLDNWNEVNKALTFYPISF